MLDEVCPQCQTHKLQKRVGRFGPFVGCSGYPDCDFAACNPPDPDHPCPECGSLLLRRPKSLRCWNCGAELDLDHQVTKSGDVEEEAAARAAKAAAKAARAAAKAKRAPAQKTKKTKKTTKKKTTKTKTTKRKAAATTTKQQPAAAKAAAAAKTATAAAERAPTLPAAEG